LHYKQTVLFLNLQKDKNPPQRILPQYLPTFHPIPFELALIKVPKQLPHWKLVIVYLTLQLPQHVLSV
jgi:hypothetical protein